MDLKKEFQIADNLISQEKRVKAQIKIAQKFAEHYQALQLQQTGVIGSYSEKDIDNAYDKGFKDAMLKYRTDL